MTETAITLNLTCMLGAAKGDYHYLCALSDAFPSGEALWVKWDDGEECLATRDRHVWGEMPGAHCYKIDA